MREITSWNEPSAGTSGHQLESLSAAEHRLQQFLFKQVQNDR